MAKGSTSINTNNIKIACVLWCLGLLFIGQQTIPRDLPKSCYSKEINKPTFMEWN